MKDKPPRRQRSGPKRSSPPSSKAPASRSIVRRVALEALMAADASGKFIDEVLGDRIGALEGRDRHLLQEITYGTIRHRNTLDHLLNFHLKVPVSQQKAPVRWAIRLGAYQLVYLGRIPPHAAVNQTLEGLKAVPGTGLREVGFVNAVLHKIGDEIRRKSSERPLERDDPA